MSHAVNPATVTYKDLFIYVSEEKMKVSQAINGEEAAYDDLIIEI